MREPLQPPRSRWDGREPDLAPLLALIESLRSAVPHDVSEQARGLLRELLLTLRALIDWYLERLDAEPEEEPRVEEIPIE